MTNINSPKIACKFKCENCKYICYKQSDYNKHILTAKHKRLTMTNINSPEIAKSYSCECGKVYMHLSSLCKHKRTCSLIHNTNSNTNEKPSMMDIISQNKEIIDILVLQNEELRNTIKEMVPKIGNNNTTNNNNNNN